MRNGTDGKARTRSSIASHFLWLPMLGHSGDVASIAGALRLERVYQKNAFLSTHLFESYPACYLLHATRYRTQGPFYPVRLLFVAVGRRGFMQCAAVTELGLNHPT